MSPPAARRPPARKAKSNASRKMNVAAGASPASGITRRGMMLVLSSPSGAGKTTIARRLKQAESNLNVSISVTTRPQRPGESDGIDYHFVSHERFEAMTKSNELLEHATVFDYGYGTPVGPVDAALAAGKDMLFDVDWQGAQQIRTRRGSDIVSVFILPPDVATLRERLIKRKRDPEDVVARRMAWAADEISHYGEYDYVVINDELEQCVAQVQAILNAERARASRLPGLADFVGVLTER